MIANVEWTSASGSSPCRLDVAVLARCPTSSRGLVIRAIEEGTILLDDRPAPKGRRVVPGSRITVVRLLERTDSWVVPEPDLPLIMLREDPLFVALDKPAGMPVHPLAPGETGTLAGALAARHPECAQAGDEPAMGGILHRLDGGTSGVILAARTREAYRAIRDQFRRHAIDKTYLAVVEGHVPAAGRIESLLAHTPGDRGRMRGIPADGDARGERVLRAITEYEPIERRESTTLLRVRIRTGVTHQIRCQLAAAGWPIVGDRVYGSDSWGTGAARHLLHAAEIVFTHPGTGERVRVESPAPPEFAAG